MDNTLGTDSPFNTYLREHGIRVPHDDNPIGALIVARDYIESFYADLEARRTTPRSS